MDPFSGLIRSSIFKHYLVIWIFSRTSQLFGHSFDSGHTFPLQMKSIIQKPTKQIIKDNFFHPDMRKLRNQKSNCDPYLTYLASAFRFHSSSPVAITLNLLQTWAQQHKSLWSINEYESTMSISSSANSRKVFSTSSSSFMLKNIWSHTHRGNVLLTN